LSREGSPPVVVTATNASFGYEGNVAVRGITATIHEGEAVALIGPNGSGKSTLLKGLIGLTELLAGRVHILGKQPRAAREDVGVLPQADQREVNLPVSVKQVVSMGLYRQLGAIRPFRKKERNRVRTALTRVGLQNQAEALFGDLSGGQQQRVILARALVSEPRVLLLDEPFNGLDRPNRESLLETIRQLRREGTTILVSTHDLEIAQEACSHAMLLDRRMVSFGPLEQALTLENISEAFHDTSVEIDSHTITTRSEADPEVDPGHLHHEHHETQTQLAHENGVTAARFEDDTDYANEKGREQL
jgi:zinc/manganese transport system ATP-binding protein